MSDYIIRLPEEMLAKQLSLTESLHLEFVCRRWVSLEEFLNSFNGYLFKTLHYYPNYHKNALDDRSSLYHFGKTIDNATQCKWLTRKLPNISLTFFSKYEIIYSAYRNNHLTSSASHYISTSIAKLWTVSLSGK